MRTKEFIGHPHADAFLEEINNLVAAGENQVDVEPESNYPLFLVVGAPRSGTTVLMQWLQSIGVSVPTNIAARFYRNPIFAGMLQRLLIDPELNYRQELSVFSPDEEYSSIYGKTRGLLSPHEFSYFIRQFFPVTTGEVLSSTQLEACDVRGFLKGLRAFAIASGAPVAIKALLIQYHLNLFLHHNDVFVIHVLRNEVNNVCSLLRHRELVAGDQSEWISVRPPGYEWLRHLAPIYQVAGQVRFTNAVISRQLKNFPGERVIELSHELFCSDPRSYYDSITRVVRQVSSLVLPEYSGADSFDVTTYAPHSAQFAIAESALTFVTRHEDEYCISHTG